MRRPGRLILCIFSLVWLPACGDDYILLGLDPLPLGTAAVQVDLSRDGAAVTSTRVPVGDAEPRSFRIAKQGAADLLLKIFALDNANCHLGHVQSRLFGPATSSAQLVLTPLEPARCPLQVVFTGAATGQVDSWDVSLALPEHQAEKEELFQDLLARQTNQTFRLVPRVQTAEDYFAGWSGDCTGFAECVLPRDRAARVTARFARKLVTPEGWRWEHPTPQGRQLTGIWGPADSTELWAVADYNGILHFDGKQWSEVENAPDGWSVDSHLEAVFGTAANNVYAVGSQGVVQRYDGNRWQRLRGTPGGAYLRGIWGVDPSEMWVAAGTLSVSYRGLLYRGTTAKGRSELSFSTFWDAYGNLGSLYSIAGRAADDIWVTGWKSLGHYNGRNWELVETPGVLQNSPKSPPSPDDYRINVILPADPNNLWLGSAQGIFRRHNGVWQATVITDWIRSGWQAPDGTPWFVGMTATPNEPYRAYRWDGTAWQVIPLPPRCHGYRIWGRSEGDLWVSGDGGNSREACLARWDGRRFVPQYRAVRKDHLNGIWGTNENNLWAVGNAGTVLRWNGIEWIDGNPIESGSATNQDLLGISGSDGWDAWAVGRNGTMLRLWGSVWRQISVPTVTQHLYSVSFVQKPPGERAARCPAQSYFYAVGEAGTLVYGENGNIYDCSTAENRAAFKACTLAVEQKALYGVWAKDCDQVVVVGAEGTLRRFDGTTWLNENQGMAELRGVYGVSAKDITVVGRDTLLHWDGSAWTRLVGTTELGGAVLYSVWYRDWRSFDGWAVGDGAILRLVGPNSWRRQRSIVQRQRSVWGFSDPGNFPTVHLAGHSGAILRYVGR